MNLSQLDNFSIQSHEGQGVTNNQQIGSFTQQLVHANNNNKTSKPLIILHRKGQ